VNVITIDDHYIALFTATFIGGIIIGYIGCLLIEKIIGPPKKPLDGF